MNCQNCKATATIEISFNNRQHGGEPDTEWIRTIEIRGYCVSHFVEADVAGQIPSGVGIEMALSAEQELDGYFG